MQDKDWPQLLSLARTQFLYTLLIGAKNEWNARVARGETIPAPTSETLPAPMKRAYLHFLNPNEVREKVCACDHSYLPGTHAEFACTIVKS